MSKTSSNYRTLKSRGVRVAVVALIAAAFFLASLVLIHRPVSADTGTGSISLTTIGVAATENFDTLVNTAASTTNTTLPTGWYITETGGGARDNEQYGVDTGASTTGDIYSYGAAAATDRALGALRSGTLIPLYGAKFTNNTGVTITTLDVSYIGEEWRCGTALRTDQINFEISTNATDLSTGTYTGVAALNFTSPDTATVGAKNGNAAADRTAISTTMSSLSIPNGATFFIRWTDTDASGADDGLSVDDFSVTPSAVVVDTAPSVSSTNPPDNATGVAVASNISVTFSEPVNAPVGAFSISCVSSGAHTFVLSGGPTTFTLDPNVDFSLNEVCTVTVDDAQVTDVDAIDPPDNMAADFVFDFTTVDPSSCGTAFTPIYTIQGSGTASPMVGVGATTEGIVVGDFQHAGSFSGFYLQDPTGDANTATSDGIFVFTATAVNVGDRVRVTGTVSEQFNNTQINPASAVVVCSTGNPLPPPVSYDLPEPVNNDLERVENMLVTFPETLTVTGNFTLGRFGEAVLSSDGRLFQQNNFDRTNSVAALAVAALNPRRYVVLDDGLSIQNPDPTPYFNASNTRRVGDTVTGLTGVLTFDFSEYRLEPTTAPVFVSANPRTAAPASVGNELSPNFVKASSFNVLNYFNGDGAGGGFPTSRGATSLAEFNRQRDKIIAAIIAINADVSGVIEIENDGSTATSAISDLVNGLNAATAPGTYDFRDGTTPGTDAIKNSIIYKTARVTPEGAAVNDTDAIWAGQARNPLAQTFTLNSNGAKFVYIVNHFTSKACSASDTGLDADQGDGQGCDNLQRTLQAEALLEFVEERQTTTLQTRVLVMGDLNAAGEEDPIFRLENDMNDTLNDGPLGLIDLIQRLVPVADRYSYQFDEQSAYIDHALASKELNNYISGTTIWHINADEPTVLDYNVEFKSVAQQGINVGTPYRASDHDAVVVGINLLLPTAANGIVSGRITDPNGVPVSGAVVQLSGTQTRKSISDANGNYQFENVETNGFYTATPSRANYSFSPANRSFTLVGGRTEATFTASSTGDATNPLEVSEYFVRQQYLDLLGREPDEGGFNYWSDQINQCGNDSSCTSARRRDVAAAFFIEEEFQRTGSFVYGLYKGALGRRPAFLEYSADRQQVVGGANLEARKQAFAESFVRRTDFSQRYQSNTSAESFVDAMVQNVRQSSGVDLGNQRDSLIDRYNSGANLDQSRSFVVRDLTESASFKQAEYNAAFVLSEYFSYLRRNPDSSGYDFWLNVLNSSDSGNYRGMVCAFITSTEYQRRFSSVISRGDGECSR
jgi:predicted extracellular nuclease